MRVATIIAVGAAALVTACGASSGASTHGTTTSPTVTTTTTTVTQMVTSTTTTTTVIGPHTTVDPQSAENVIRTNISKFGSIQATFVSCPSGVEKVEGATLNCKVTLKNISTGATASGTITLHITNGGKEATFSGSDVHVK